MRAPRFFHQMKRNRFKPLRYFLFGALLAAVLFATGCVRTYRRRDIEQYLKKEYALRSFFVSEEPTEIEGMDGYTDKLWTVVIFENSGFPLYITLPDERFAFRVLDDRYYSLWADNRLRSDYGACLLREIADGYDGFSSASLSFTEDEEFMLTASLTGHFESARELQALCGEAARFLAYAGEKGFSEDLNIRFSTTDPIDGSEAVFWKWASPQEAGGLAEEADEWYEKLLAPPESKPDA